jgi:hypothetical protein
MLSASIAEKREAGVCVVHCTAGYRRYGLG